jgi:hypothetical protein
MCLLGAPQPLGCVVRFPCGIIGAGYWRKQKKAYEDHKKEADLY